MEINYLSNKEGEIDFVISEGGSVAELIQVTYELDQKNIGRELQPLLSAMKALKPKRSVLVTFNAVDKVMAVEKGIDTLTFVQWALSARNGKS